MTIGKGRLAHSGCLALSLLLAGCSTSNVNSALHSARQPVVERSTFVIDLATAGDGLAPAEQIRLDDWFTSLALSYGDRVSIAGGSVGPRLGATIEALAAAHGVMLEQDAMVPAGDLAPGQVRILIRRSSAHVPGCPDWSAKSDAMLDNATSPGFGCAVNGNFAAMVADPEHLLEGARGTGQTVVMSATKAIASYRALEPTGAVDLGEVSSQGDDQ